MPNTYTLISSNTLGSTAASVTLSSIPATYTDLMLKMSVRTSDGGFSYFNLFTNGINTGTNYSSTGLRYNLALGAGVTSGRQSNAATWQYEITTGNNNPSTANTFSNADIYFSNYLATTSKPISGFYVTESNSTTADFGIGIGAGQDRGTSAINSITIANLGAVVFQVNSSFYLYGIKNS